MNCAKAHWVQFNSWSEARNHVVKVYNSCCVSINSSIITSRAKIEGVNPFILALFIVIRFWLSSFAFDFSKTMLALNGNFKFSTKDITYFLGEVFFTLFLSLEYYTIAKEIKTSLVK